MSYSNWLPNTQTKERLRWEQEKPKHTTRICSHMCGGQEHAPRHLANQESNLGKMLGFWAFPYWNEDNHMVCVLELLWRWNVKCLYNQIETMTHMFQSGNQMADAFKTSFFFFFHSFIQQTCSQHSIFSILAGNIRSTQSLPALQEFTVEWCNNK